jgi:hypothetical protein
LQRSIFLPDWLANRCGEQQAQHRQANPAGAGVTGYYTEGVCGVNCPDSVISWREGPNEYTAGIKGGGETDVAAS